MRVTYFQSRRPGPEAIIEDAVSSRLRDLFFSPDDVFWVAGSLAVASVKPDLLAVGFVPETLQLAALPQEAAWILCQLRVRETHTLETLRALGFSMRLAMRTLEATLACGVVAEAGGIFRLTDIGRNLLMPVISVEAKIHDLQRANYQCAIASLCAHAAYLAAPPAAIRRAKGIARFDRFGLISVTDDQSVELVRRAKIRMPVAWNHYYEIALAVAKLHPAEAASPQEARRLLKF